MVKGVKQSSHSSRPSLYKDSLSLIRTSPTQHRVTSLSSSLPATLKRGYWLFYLTQGLSLFLTNCTLKLGGKDKGELVFYTVIKKMLEKISSIADLCSLAFNNLVDPILEDSKLLLTSGLMLLKAGEIPAF